MAIHGHHPIRLPWPAVNGLASPRLVQDEGKDLAGLVRGHLAQNTTDGVGARFASTDPRLPASGQTKLLLESVETTQAQHVQPECGEPDGTGRDSGQEPTIVQRRDQGAQTEAFLEIGGEAPEQSYLSRFSSRSRKPSEICSRSWRTSE